MSIKSVGIGFENCEYVELPASNIVSFSVSGVTSTYVFDKGNSFAKRELKNCTGFLLEATSDTKVFTTMGNELKDRLLKYGDITSLSLAYTDGSSETFYVVWSDESEGDENTNQRAHSYGNTVTVEA